MSKSFGSSMALFVLLCASLYAGFAKADQSLAALRTFSTKIEKTGFYYTEGHLMVVDNRDAEFPKVASCKLTDKMRMTEHDSGAPFTLYIFAQCVTAEGTTLPAAAVGLKVTDGGLIGINSEGQARSLGLPPKVLVTTAVYNGTPYQYVSLD